MELKKPTEVVLKGKVLDKLWESYLDSLKLEKKNDLTEWGEGEMFALRRIFEGKLSVTIK